VSCSDTPSVYPASHGIDLLKFQRCLAERASRAEIFSSRVNGRGNHFNRIIG
jgi:hypothetical protein